MGQLFNKNESKYLENMVKWKVAKVGYLTLTHFQDSHWSIGQESKNESNGQKVWLIVRQKTVGFNSTLTYTRGGGKKAYIQNTAYSNSTALLWKLSRRPFKQELFFKYNRKSITLFNVNTVEIEHL